MRHLQTIATFVVLMSFISSISQAIEPVVAETVTSSNIDSQPYEKLIMTTGFSERVQPTIDKGEMPPPSDPSFIRRLREEIYKVEAAEAKKNEGHGTKHVLRHVSKNFAPDSITFAIAGGLVYFTQLQLVTKSDPALMVKHLEALKDPIAHISFGAFMVANGIYIDMKTRGLDPLTKQLAMKTLTYKGLAVGSFASSLTADILVTMKECTKGWISNKNDQASQAACDFAYKQWTFRNKFVQYAPQILSLLAAQKISEVAEKGGKMAGHIFIKPGVKSLDSNTVKFFKLTAANIDLVITGGGGVVVKSVRWMGKLTKFSMFLAIDHAVQPTVSRVGHNLIQPIFFDFDALAINRYLKYGSHYNWSEQKASAAGQSFAKFPKEILNFTERMAAWRMHLNNKAEGDLAGWLDASSKLLHQIDYAKNFYLKYIENVYDTLNRQHLVNQGAFDDAPDRAWALERRFPLRTLPLYGVKSNHNYGEVPENDIYLLKPFDIEPRQSAFVKQATISFYPALGVSFGLVGKPLDEAKALIQPLTTDLTPYQQGVYLDRINKRFKEIPPPPMPTRAGIPEDTNKSFRSALKAYKTVLGNPMPQLKEGMGFNMAFDTHIGNYQLGQEAGFDLKDENYKFAKPSDLMLFNMICGPAQAHIEEGMLSGINFFAPRITSHPGELEICKNTWIMKNVTSDKIHDWKITADGTTYTNPTRYLMARMQPQLLGNFRDEEKLDKGQGFDAWWAKSIIPTLQQTLKTMDERYGKVVEIADQQINDHKGFVDWAIDGVTNGSYYLDKNIGDNLRFEFEVYYRILKTILLNDQIKSDAYLVDVAEWSRNNRFNIPLMNDVASAKRIVKENKYLLDLVQTSEEEITTLDDVASKLLMPAREKLDLLKEKVLPTAKNSTLASDIKTLEIKLTKVTAEMNQLRMLEFEMNYKNFMALLSRPSLKFDEMIAAKEKLYKSNTIVLGTFKQMAELAGAEKLPTEVQTLLAVANGLEALEIEVNRFLLMKVKLADRLELDMSQLNTFLKHKSIAPQQRSGAKPHQN